MHYKYLHTIAYISDNELTKETNSAHFYTLEHEYKDWADNAGIFFEVFIISNTVTKKSYLYVWVLY